MLMLQMVSELSSAAAELEREALPALEVLTKRVSARHALCMLHALMTELWCRPQPPVHRACSRLCSQMSSLRLSTWSLLSWLSLLAVQIRQPDLEAVRRAKSKLVRLKTRTESVRRCHPLAAWPHCAAKPAIEVFGPRMLICCWN